MDADMSQTPPEEDGTHVPMLDLTAVAEAAVGTGYIERAGYAAAAVEAAVAVAAVAAADHAAPAAVSETVSENRLALPTQCSLARSKNVRHCCCYCHYCH